MSPEGKTPKTARRKAAGVGDNSSGDGYLDGQLLIAMPVMGDPRFERSVIYMCAHSSEGAMGIIVNRPAGSIDFPGLLVQLDIIKTADQIKLPENAETMKVLKGGPVDTGRGFVLHSSDFFIKDATLNIDDGICLTATVDILKAIAKGAGPKHAILALGYAGWAPGQLENEIQHNGWLHCDADPDLIFGGDVEEKYRARCARSASIPACCRTKPGTREFPLRRPCEAGPVTRGYAQACPPSTISVPMDGGPLRIAQPTAWHSTPPPAAAPSARCRQPWRGACRGAATGRSGARGAWSGGCPTSRGHAPSICGRGRIPAAWRAR